MSWLVKDLSATWTRLCVYLVTLHLFTICFDKINCVFDVYCIQTPVSTSSVYQQWQLLQTVWILKFLSNFCPSLKQNRYKKFFSCIWRKTSRFNLKISFNFCMFIFYSAFVNTDARFQSLHNLVLKEVCRVINHTLLFEVVKIGYFYQDFYNIL